MKKVNFLLAAVLSLSLVACGGSKKSDASSDVSKKSNFYETYGYSPEESDKSFDNDAFWNDIAAVLNKYGLEDFPEDEDSDNEDYETDGYDDSDDYGSYYEDDDYADYYSSDDNDYYYTYGDESEETKPTASSGYVAQTPASDDSEFTRSAELIAGALPSAKKNAKWTVMLYLCGSDLESENSCATVDLNEIVQASLGNNVNVVIETGGANKWDSTYGISTSYLQRWIVQNGKLEKVDQVKYNSMGEASTLSDFVSWAAKAYPAEKYIIDFWNHGSGSVYGVCFDEKQIDSLGNKDSLQISELRKALSVAGVKFEAFFFDTCLSATVEMANALAPFGKYMIASEEVVMSGCTGYKSWLSGLSKYPDMTGADLGKKICQIYQGVMNEVGYGKECTMSTIDLAKIAPVQKAFEEMAASMTKRTENVTSMRNLVRNGQKVTKYGPNSDNEGWTNLVDLSDLATQASAEVPNEAKKLQAAIKDAVIYEIHGENEGSSSGLAVYYPVKYTGDTDVYAKNVNNVPYLMYLDAILDQWKAPSGITKALAKKSIKPVQSKNYDVQFNTVITEENNTANFTLNVTSGLEIIDSVDFNIYMFDQEAKEIVYLGNDNDILCDWKKGQFKDNFAATWLSIAGHYINAELIAEDGKINVYSIPVRVNGQTTNIRATYSFEKNEYEIVGLMDPSQNHAASKGYKKLRKGDKIQFLYSAASLDKPEEEIEYLSDEVIYDPATFVLSDEETPAGVYFYEFEITDIFGNVKTTDMVMMTYGEDKSITLDTLDDAE